MRLRSTPFQPITRRTSIQTMLLLFTQGVMAATNHFTTDSTAPSMWHAPQLLRFPGVLSPAFFAGTKPFQGITHFDDAVVAPPTNLLLQTPSPATIADVGNPALYPGVGAKATGWDFTLTATAGNVTAAFTGSGANTGTTTDYCVRCNRSMAGQSLTTVGVKTDDASHIQLLTVWLKLNLIPNNPASLCDITLTGYKAGAPVASAVSAKTGLQTQVWTKFDVSANTNFRGIDEFRFTAAPASGVVVSSMFVDEIELPTTPLPLVLIDFAGHRDGSDVRLNWTTASEENTAAFDIQRRGEGGSWTTIGTVAAAGNSNSIKDYNYTDATLPRDGSNYLYRLRMSDLDGQSTYSKVLSIGGASGAAFLSAYPNPCRNNLNVSVGSPEAGKGALLVRDMSGKLVITENVTLQKGSNNFTLPAIAALPKGTYLLTLSTTQQQSSVSILKAD